jgi:hypothetical protein
MRPSWLDPRDEVTTAPPRVPRPRALAAMVDLCRAHGLTIRQSLEVTAHACLETGGFQKHLAFNVWGWKANRDWADAHRARTGHGPPWWQRAGHAASLDPPVCYYRGFGSAGESLEAFLRHFCPRPGATPPAPRYRPAGLAFWQRDGVGWMAAILAAGYRGRPTAAKPAGSLALHTKLAVEAAECWAQGRLAVSVDGAWGPRSRAACAAFQRGAGLPPTGEPDDDTLAMLARAGAAG